MGDKEIDFLKSMYSIDAEELAKVLDVSYRRITLISKSMQEKITIDFDLKYKQDSKANTVQKLVIAEVKQSRYTRRSPFVSVLRSYNVKQVSLSKYALGVTMLSLCEKDNAYRHKVKLVEKITNGIQL
jgi:hypothetical protein